MKFKSVLTSTINKSRNLIFNGMSSIPSTSRSFHY